MPSCMSEGLSATPGPEVIKLFSCSTQLRSKFILLINVKMPTIVGILTFISRINDWLLWPKPEFSIDFGYFSNYEQLKFHAQLSWDWKKFYNLGTWTVTTAIRHSNSDFNLNFNENVSRNKPRSVVYQYDRRSIPPISQKRTQSFIIDLLFSSEIQIMLFLVM